MSTFTFDITVTADTICAWCYINHVRLAKAIHLYSKTYNSRDVFRIVYRPYILQPQLTSQSEPVAEKFLERFGSERAETISRMMDRVAGADGIKFSKNGRVGDSRISHRVIAMVGEEGTPDSQSAVVGEIMRRYYEEDGDITDKEMLIDCAVRLGGLSREMVQTALIDAKLGTSIDEQARLARERGINGVPHMIINGVELEGAKDVEDLFHELISIKEQISSATQQSTDACSSEVCI